MYKLFIDDDVPRPADGGIIKVAANAEGVYKMRCVGAVSLTTQSRHLCSP